MNEKLKQELNYEDDVQLSYRLTIRKIVKTAILTVINEIEDDAVLETVEDEEAK